MTDLPRYICLHEPGKAYGEKALIFDEKSGKPLVLPYVQAAVLSKFDRFRSLDDHLGVISVDVGSHNRPLLESAIQELLHRGLLFSREDLQNELKRLSLSSSPDDGGKVTSLVWVTADRPVKLEESVRSFAAACSAHGRTVRFVVLDDSHIPENADAGRRLVESIKSPDRTGHFSLEYMGPREKAGYREKLKKSLSGFPGIDRTLAFALTGHDGANRNLAFLKTTGELFVSTDDDTQGLFARHPAAAQGNALEFSSAQDPTEFFLYPDRKELLADTSLDSIDIFGEHEKILGRQAAGLLIKAGDEAIFRNARPDSLRRLLENGGRVLTTMSGICGDSGMTNSKAVLTYDRDDRETLFQDGGYERVRLFREVLRLAPQKVLSTGPFYMSGHVGFDNRGLLPPFFPQFRNADGLFGFQINLLFDDGLIGHIPYAVYHDPLGTRTSPEKSLLTWKSGTTDTLSLLCGGFRSASDPGWKGASSRGEVIAALGSYLRGIASMPPDDLYEYIRLEYLPFTADYIDTLNEYLLRFAGEPATWAADVESLISFIEKHVADEDFFLPAELRDGSPPDTVMERFRCLVENYGILLESWPEICEAARTINEER